jgi:diguanylate cyclase
MNTPSAVQRPSPTDQDLAEALRARQLTLNYQPIINMSNRSVCGFEALTRWSHPTMGPISPGIFIPMAEESGLIVELSKWALRESCRALKRIEGRTGRNSSLYMSVNFTPRDFTEDKFIFDLYNIISESDVLPSQIQLEITEALMLNQPENALSSLTMCRKAGMKISVDDCATTQQDLSYLSKYPIDSVKIDQIFIRKMLTDPESRRIVEWVITTAEKMGKKPIAEGVEKEEEAQALMAAGCTQAQGYLYAKPLPEKEVIDFLMSAPLRGKY